MTAMMLAVTLDKSRLNFVNTLECNVYDHITRIWNELCPAVFYCARVLCLLRGRRAKGYVLASVVHASRRTEAIGIEIYRWQSIPTNVQGHGWKSKNKLWTPVESGRVLSEDILWVSEVMFFVGTLRVSEDMLWLSMHMLWTCECLGTCFEWLRTCCGCSRTCCGCVRICFECPRTRLSANVLKDLCQMNRK